MQIKQGYPIIRRARVEQLRLARRVADLRVRDTFAGTISTELLPVVLVRHASLLRRRLGDSDPRLQETKIVNLRLAVPSLDRLLIRPGETVSFWHRVGAPAARRGYQDGLVLASGRVRSGTGGGLCQLSNLLHWIALHAPVEITEHHHHSFDPFPDDRRVLPFGSGAGVFYNYVDLRLRNPTSLTFQLALQVTDEHLRGELRADRRWPYSFHVEERDHRFVRGGGGRVFRENELWRRTVDRRTGDTVSFELITRNHAEVGYGVDPALIEDGSVDSDRDSARRAAP
jgi:vancomycin resistance protein VanW